MNGLATLILKWVLAFVTAIAISASGLWVGSVEKRLERIEGKLDRVLFEGGHR